MNWVWANSPTSGNERLVLLALADACSRDDGTGCWPSAATIARKANISDRTVRRVIARLEADGHVTVHRGGGRAGSSNSYTVVTVIHSPGQTVTPDNLSGGDTADRPPRTQPCQGTPDTAVSPEPPPNHQRTAAHAGLRAEPAAAPPAEEAAGTREFFARLADRNPLWRLTAPQQRRLGPAVAAALAAGWAPAALVEATGANTAGIRNPGAVLAARLSPAQLPPPTASSARRPPWCGQCDQATRMLDYHGDAPRPCPRCKGSAKQVIALHPRQPTTTPPPPGADHRDLQR
jgi:Helix-turn-helix domain